MAALDIFGHIVDQREIIGIGPLMSSMTKDQTYNQLYNPRRLFFQLHCRHQSIEITSDFFLLGDAGDPVSLTEENRKASTDFKEYAAAHKRICRDIKEMIEQRSYNEQD